MMSRSLPSNEERELGGRIGDPEIERLLTSPTLAQNPYVLYERLREMPADAYFSPSWGQWIVTRYDPVVDVMKRHKEFSSEGMEEEALATLPSTDTEPLDALRQHFETHVLGNTDRPAHTRLRKAIGPGLAPSMLEDVKPRVEEVVSELVGRLQPGLTDVLSEFFYPLPAIIIAELLGAPVKDSRRFERWSADFVSYIGSETPMIERARTADRSMAEFRGYIASLIDDRRDRPGSDLLGTLITSEATEGDEPLSTSELIAMCVTVLFAGHETTANLLGNGLLALLDHPEQLEHLVSDPDLAEGATEELLRFDSPVQRVKRVATTDVDLGGTHIEPGPRVLAFTGSANRDDSRFSDADTLDITRTDVRHIAFGHGVHSCIGAPLSRLEAPIAFRALLDRFPDIRLGPERPKYKNNIVFRGLESLVVDLR